MLESTSLVFIMLSCPDGAYLWRAFLIQSWKNIRGSNLHNCIFKWSPLLDVIVSFELAGGRMG